MWVIAFCSLFASSSAVSSSLEEICSELETMILVNGGLWLSAKKALAEKSSDKATREQMTDITRRRPGETVKDSLRRIEQTEQAARSYTTNKKLDKRIEQTNFLALKDASTVFANLNCMGKK